MKVIIAGSRDINDYELVKQAIKESEFHITEVVSGNARGVDQCGEEWAFDFDIPIKMFKPDWDKFGKSAGIRRNEEMANYADALIAIWDGSSRGTNHMIEYATKKGIDVFVKKI